ncbi:aconitate hydratase AcnA [Desulfobulbus alkaliphilus]|uniref:aconitate hydratase AcnA n=1 Tax=Desulfobulbus alkaliphilus TaxID=869814 RepID=UPI001964459F|nr:aconitate hydratase AcnA [Desulfobulbus alkaliphilus]MBM9536794.1 aconitate hydratase AcnA [Desulfobulbus alkaliphilus]
MAASNDIASLDPRTTLEVHGTTYTIYSVKTLERLGFGPVDRLPYSIRVLLENLLRHFPQGLASAEDIANLASWQADRDQLAAIPFMPARVILQDFTGVPALVDLAAMRAALARNGGDPATMNPAIPADLVIDHSIQVDQSANPEAFSANVDLEMERNKERYTMLHWGQQAFRNFRVVPPGIGIVHQVNLEYLATGVGTTAENGGSIVYPDSVLGTDSHTTMINGLGVMGWGVGGIEAEAVLLGQPYSLQIPEVVGVRLHGALRPGVTATDLVLTLTRFLRAKGVVGRFVEFFGPGLQHLRLPDRATIANMAPEYGATMGFFPVDAETLHYLETSGRPTELVDLVAAYCRAQGFFLEPGSPTPDYTAAYELDLGEVVPSLSGPKRPQDLLPLAVVRDDFHHQFEQELGRSTAPSADDPLTVLTNGAVIIAAITSCTNTSNPDVMIGAGLLARKARQRGLSPRPWVKTSMAPGSRVVTGYLKASGLLPDLEALGFHVIGYGCATCIGNSGPLDQAVAATIQEKQLVAAAVVSGNRNFEARIHPLVRANYLGSPLLVVAYALAGTIRINLDSEPLGVDSQGQPVYLRDVWPTEEEVRTVVQQTLNPDLFTAGYADVFAGDTRWNALEGGGGDLYQWDPDSSYIREPPFFQDMSMEPAPPADIIGARILALFGDSITTDHISPAGTIGPDTPAGQYLQQQGISPEDFNSYGSRRGNHEVMMRGTFANIRIKNRMVDRDGGWTKLWPGATDMPIYDAAMAYRADQIPLVVFAGRDYGTGSSRDWAAKGTLLLGVKAVIAASFERIHRSNLVGMGILPLQFLDGTNVDSLRLDGSETISINGLSAQLTPIQTVTLEIARADGRTDITPVRLRLDSEMEIDYYRHGGILHKVLRQRLAAR